MFPLSRVTPLSLRTVARKRSPAQVRTIHTTKPHTAYNNFPFTYENKRKFAVKYASTAAVCFTLPFIAAGYQLRKAAGGSA